MDKANNGQEAFNLVRANKSCESPYHNPYELVILDNRMPYISGVEVAEKIREYQANGDVSLQTKVVLATGETRCIDEKSLFDKIILKPIKAAEFRQFIVGLNL